VTQSDPIVAEIRELREQIAARFNFDIHALAEDVRRPDAAGDRKVVRLPSRRPAGYASDGAAIEDVA
jgi:hypothetical protein